MVERWWWLAVHCCFLCVLGCSKKADEPPATPPEPPQPPKSAAPIPVTGEADRRWEEFVDQFIEDSFRTDPPFAVLQGRHEFDGQMPDLSADGIAKEIERLKVARETARAFDIAALSPTKAFERDYLIASIDGRLFWMVDAKWHERSPMFYSESLDPEPYLTREYAPLRDRLQAYVKWASAVPAATGHVKANLRTPIAKSYAQVGKAMYAGMADFLTQEVPAVFKSVEEAPLNSAFAEANRQAAAAFRDLSRWFEQQEKVGTGDYALGAPLFAKMLADTEQVTVSIDELERIGRADLARNLALLEGACEQIAKGKPVRDCIAQVNANKPKDGPVAGAKAQLAGLKQFIADKQLVTIPGDEEAVVAEAPPYRRFNMAYITIPGKFEKNLPSVYYIAPPDPRWTKKEREEYVPGGADLLYISVHEVWPGHFLNFLHAKRSKSVLGQVFVGYAFSEGWAHYTEEMMWDAGLGDRDPVQHVGQLTNALLRNVRFLSALGLHTKGMTVAESQKMFVEQAFQSVGASRQQAARGTFDPSYLNYTLGKLMIVKLRDDWTKSRGGRAAWKQFHDRFLSYGGPPIPLVRRAMLPGDDGPLL